MRVIKNRFIRPPVIWWSKKHIAKKLQGSDTVWRWFIQISFCLREDVYLSYFISEANDVNDS